MKRCSKEYIIEKLNLLYPDAECELNHSNNFELLIAVVLSAQTTDASVNKVTGKLLNQKMSILSYFSPLCFLF